VGIALDITDTEQQESKVEEEEEQEERHGGPQGAEQQDGGEDEPALKVVLAHLIPQQAQDQPRGTLTMRNNPKEL
jgi:hypothetical protein